MKRIVLAGYMSYIIDECNVETYRALTSKVNNCIFTITLIHDANIIHLYFLLINYIE